MGRGRPDGPLALGITDIGAMQHGFTCICMVVCISYALAKTTLTQAGYGASQQRRNIDVFRPTIKIFEKPLVSIIFLHFLLDCFKTRNKNFLITHCHEMDFPATHLKCTSLVHTIFVTHCTKHEHVPYGRYAAEFCLLYGICHCDLQPY